MIGDKFKYCYYWIFFFYFISSSLTLHLVFHLRCVVLFAVMRVSFRFRTTEIKTVAGGGVANDDDNGNEWREEIEKISCRLDAVLPVAGGWVCRVGRCCLQESCSKQQYFQLRLAGGCCGASKRIKTEREWGGKEIRTILFFRLIHHRRDGSRVTRLFKKISFALFSFLLAATVTAAFPCFHPFSFSHSCHFGPSVLHHTTTPYRGAVEAIVVRILISPLLIFSTISHWSAAAAACALDMLPRATEECYQRRYCFTFFV